MRLGFFLVAAVAAVAAAGAVAAPAPTYTLTFQGSGTQHQVDQRQNIQDNSTCDSAEHVDVTATMVWLTAWPGFRPTTRPALISPTRIDGSRVDGTHVKDACGLPLDRAPEGWASETSCNDALVASSGPQLTAVSNTKSLVIALAAPSFAIPSTQKAAMAPDRTASFETIPGHTPPHA
jgi:hypothetical protein